MWKWRHDFERRAARRQRVGITIAKKVREPVDEKAILAGHTSKDSHLALLLNTGRFKRRFFVAVCLYDNVDDGSLTAPQQL